MRIYRNSQKFYINRAMDQVFDKSIALPKILPFEFAISNKELYNE
jgi:hypothetical protein